SEDDAAGETAEQDPEETAGQSEPSRKKAKAKIPVYDEEEEDFLDDEDEDFPEDEEIPQAEYKEAPEGKRKAPVEESDFDSDAADFMDSGDSEDGGPGRSIKEIASEVLSALRGKGIGTRELIMIAAGLLLVILIAALIVSAINGNRKTQNVTADEGLRVTVEKEPSKWCTGGEVVLGVRTKSDIQSITVNGENCEFSGKKKTQVTVNAASELLDVMVVSDTIQRAQVMIPKIDAEDPVLNISIDGGKAVMEAVDARSGLEGIYYGPMVGFSEVPVLQKYTEPFEVDGETMYCCFAADQAGNLAGPYYSDMKVAEALTISAEELSLFPGESVQLEIGRQPENSLVNGLEITNSNEAVATLSEDGTVTAVSDGTTVIEVSADGLASVSCTVTVRSEVEVTVSTLGDLTLGDDINFSPQNSFSTYASMYGNTYFFDNVRQILAGDDITFGNFEGTLTYQGERQNRIYAFRGDPSYTDILNDGSIDVVTLANNHSHDYGDVSLTDTQMYLTQAGIDYCMGEKIAYKEVEGVKIAFIGVYELDEDLDKEAQVRSTIASAKEEGADIVIIAFHWGNELETTPTSSQESLAHLAIDQGADLVVGHHPHVVQGIEVYNGKYIVYSLANFCFGGSSNPTDMDTMIFQETFRIGEGGNVSGTDVKIIPCLCSSISSSNNYQPMEANGSDAERIIQKLEERSAPYGTDIRSLL
ncbi:MAG: CapA family protein, partial [Lachnospiraceae bacterium]|nr:CapA family protein [Lachnospiraceae bacterium]